MLFRSDPNDPTALHAPVPDYLSCCNKGISGLRIGIPHAFATDGIDGEVIAAWEATGAALADLGATLVPITFPEWRLAVENWNLLCAAEAAWAHRETHPSRKAAYGTVLSGFIELGQTSTAVEMAGATISRTEFSSKMAALFLGVEAHIR